MPRAAVGRLPRRGFGERFVRGLSRSGRCSVVHGGTQEGMPELEHVLGDGDETALLRRIESRRVDLKGVEGRRDFVEPAGLARGRDEQRLLCHFSEPPDLLQQRSVDGRRRR